MTNDNDGRTVWIAVAAVLAVGMVVLAWRDHQLSGRVADLEQRLDEMKLARESLRAGGGLRREGGRADRSVRARSRRRRGRGGVQMATVEDEVAEASLAEELTAPMGRQLVENVVAEYSEAERAERRERREEHMTDRVREVVDAFVDEQALDEETATAMLDEVLATTAEMMDLHAAIMDGELEREEAQSERETVRQESDARLKELLGEEGFDALEQAMQQARGPSR